MFSEEALKLLQQTAVRAAAIQKLDTDTPVIVLPAGMSTVCAEHWQEKRARFRGTFATTVLSEFCANVRHRAGRSGSAGAWHDAAVFVDSSASRAEAIYNLGTAKDPGHCDDVARLQLRPTAAQEALDAVADKPQTQRQLAEWLEDWADLLAPYYFGDGLTNPPSLSSAIAAIRDITITSKGESGHADRDLGATRTRLEEIEAASKKSVLPAGFYFACRPADDFQERTWNIRLSILTDADKPKLVLRIVGRGDMLERIAAEFEAKVRAQIDGVGVPVFRGTFKP